MEVKYTITPNPTKLVGIKTIEVIIIAQNVSQANKMLVRDFWKKSDFMESDFVLDWRVIEK